MDRYNDILADITNIVLEKKVKWPKVYTLEKKQRVYERLMEYWLSVDDYDYCSRIQKKLKDFQ